MFKKVTFITPIVTYSSLKEDKFLILNTQKHKSGIYRLINEVNNKSYIGSAKDFRVRFWVYFSFNRLIKSNMAINKAILKYGHKNFKLERLKYCDESCLIKEEQNYIDNYKPEYNILNKAYSSLNYKHTLNTKNKFKIRVFTDNAKLKISESAKRRIISE